MRRTILAALAVLMAGTTASFAVEKLKVAVPQRGFWDSSWIEFGEAAGFFKEAGLEIEVFYTEGGAQTIATVASGSDGEIFESGSFCRFVADGTTPSRCMLSV